ncbi:sulfite oxidase-like oxidoreductase [bacterium]|nr:sulfite oxidase-like oxidoreductase [bacterium]
MSILTRKPLDPAPAARIPPGQILTRDFPILTYGGVPYIELDKWSFGVVGLVEAEKTWTWAEFMALPQVEIRSDFHCVTTWSKLDNLWKGVSIREILGRVQLRPEAKYVMAKSYGGYETNLPLSVLDDEDVLLAHSHNGEPLTKEHGGPLRLVVPKRYAWKSAKWIRRLEFMATDRPGLWERYGYHNDGDPWKEERFGR